MANNSKVIDAGAVTAYGAAVAGGYQGTYEQWCAGMADFGKSVSEVAQKAQEVSTNAAAVEEARQEVEENKAIVDDAMSDIEAAKTDALSSIGASKNDALHDIVEEGTTQYYNVYNVGTAQLNSINDAATSTLASISSTGAAQVEAIQAEGNAQYGRAKEEADAAEEQAILAGNSATAASESAQTATNMAEDASASEELASLHAEAAAASAEAAANASALEVKTITDVPIATFTDGADSIPIKGMTVNVDPVQDLHGQANPYPAGGGKNKCLPYVDRASHNGINYSIVDQAFRVSGTATGSSYSYVPPSSYSGCPVKLSAGTYTFSTSANPSDNQSKGYFVFTGFTSNEANVSPIVLAGSTLQKTVTFSEDVGLYYGVNITTGTTVDITAKVQIESGNAATAWSPYENICPITGWTGANVKRTGKNLLNPVMRNGYYDKDNDGQFVESSNWKASEKMPCEPLTQYIMSGTSYSTGGYSGRTLFWDKSGTYVGFVGSAMPLTTPENAYYMAFYTGEETVSDHMQFEKGSSASTYEAYQGTTIPITFPSEAGTVYGVTLTNNGTDEWKLVVDKGEVDLGSLAWSGSGDQIFYSTTTIQNFAIASTTTDRSTGFLCSMYPFSSNVSYSAAMDDKSMLRGNATSMPIVIRDTSYANASDFKTAMSGVQLVYELATPVEYTITASQLETLMGLNNIWADTGNIAELKYRAMFNTNLIKALIAPVLPGMVADTALAVNDFRIVGDTLYVVTAPIANGGTLTVGTNCRATNIGEQITAILNA